jgi:hypothetical protein
MFAMNNSKRATTMFYMNSFAKVRGLRYFVKLHYLVISTLELVLALGD